MQGSDEARLFLRRLKDGQKKLAFELKKMRLDRGFNDSTIIKRANDRIAFWLFEGEELWKVTRAATAAAGGSRSSSPSGNRSRSVSAMVARSVALIDLRMPAPSRA